MSSMPEERDEEFGQAVDAHRAAVFAFFRRRLRNPNDAEDATQEVFTSVLRLSDLSGIENLQSYLFKAAANHLRDRARRAAVRPRLESENDAPAFATLVDNITPERDLLGREAYGRVLSALRALPERPRTIFILNRYEEMTGREIAERLGISQRAVERHISRVLAHLRDCLS